MPSLTTNEMCRNLRQGYDAKMTRKATGVFLNFVEPPNRGQRPVGDSLGNDCPTDHFRGARTGLKLNASDPEMIGGDFPKFKNDRALAEIRIGAKEFNWTCRCALGVDVAGGSNQRQVLVAFADGRTVTINFQELERVSERLSPMPEITR